LVLSSPLVAVEVLVLTVLVLAAGSTELLVVRAVVVLLVLQTLALVA
jgi:hypothetical protein